MKRETHRKANGLRALAAVSLVCSALACGRPAVPFPPPIPPLAPPDQDVIAEWLECAGCPPEQRAPVVRVGLRAVPLLGAALRRGPPPAVEATVRLAMEERYQELLDYLKRHPEALPGSDPRLISDYVDFYVNNFKIAYRIRAAQALGGVGGEPAIKELIAARQLTAPGDLQQAIDEAITEGRGKDRSR